MARLVKCFDTNEKISKDLAFVENLNGKNRYWSSEQEYNKWTFNNQCRINSINILADIFGYSAGMKMPTVAYKKMKELEPYGYDVFEATIRAQKDNIAYALGHKNFSTEYGRVAYVFAIIQNNIMDEYKKKKRDEKIEHKETKIDFGEMDLDEIGNNKKSKNISNLLGDI